MRAHGEFSAPARLRPALLLRSISAFLLAAMCCALIVAACGKNGKTKPPSISAKLIEENNQLFVVLHNNSDSVYVLCKRNFYDPIQCLDIRKMPDTTEFPTELLFGGVLSGVVRSIITVDDFVTLDTGAELRLPVDLRPVKTDVAPGQRVLIRVYFKNIDPFFCSRVDVANYDKSIQNYCGLMHYVPNRSLHYWVGEVRTPYASVNLGVYVRRHQLAIKKQHEPVVVRRSWTHPLTKKVF